MLGKKTLARFLNCWLVLIASAFLFSLLSNAANAQSSDPVAVQVANQAIVAMAATFPADVTLNGSATYVAGSTHASGTFTFQASAGNGSRLGLQLNTLNRSDIRNGKGDRLGCAWIDDKSESHVMAIHNCWSEPEWGFPLYLPISQLSDADVVLLNLGTQQRNGQSVQVLRAFRRGKTVGAAVVKLYQQLTIVDIFLDLATQLPVAIAFNVHPDSDANTNVALTVEYSDYRPVNGIRLPFRIQRFVNGGLNLDLTVQSAAFNTGISSTTFAIPTL